MLLCLAVVSMACEKGKGNESDFLSGTKWKFVGFADIQTGTVKEIEPNNSNYYWLYFNNDKTLNGMSSINDFFGNYEIDFTDSTIQIINLEGTKINELFDGDLFIESLRIVESFSLLGKELNLYYNGRKNYLQFIEYKVSECVSCDEKKVIKILNEEPAYLRKGCFEHVGRVDTFYFELINYYDGIFSLFPCNEIPKEYRNEGMSVFISGNITNCQELGGCIEPNIKLAPINIFELTIIKDSIK
jgi:hypothetical protein